MANKKVSELPAASSVATADTVMVVQGGVSKQATVAQATAAKQETLVSGTNIKTINGVTVLGSGDLVVAGGGGGGVPSSTVGSAIYSYSTINAIPSSGQLISNPLVPASLSAITNFQIAALDAGGVDIKNTFRTLSNGDTFSVHSNLANGGAAKFIITDIFVGTTSITLYVSYVYATGPVFGAGDPLSIRLHHKGQQYTTNALAEQGRRYWRVSILAGEAATTSIAAMKFIGPSVPSSYASVTATSGSGTLSNLTDLNATTNWTTVGTYPQSVTYDCGAGVVMAPSILQIQAPVTTGSAPSSVMVSSSVDGVLWNDVYNYIGYGTWPSSEVRDINVAYKPIADGYGSSFAMWKWGATTGAVVAPFTMQPFDSAPPSTSTGFYISKVALNGLSKELTIDSMRKGDTLMIEDYISNIWWRFTLLDSPTPTGNNMIGTWKLENASGSGGAQWPTIGANVAITFARAGEVAPLTPLNQPASGYMTYAFNTDGFTTMPLGSWRFSTYYANGPQIWISKMGSGGSINNYNELQVLRSGDQIIIRSLESDKVKRINLQGMTIGGFSTDYVGFHYTIVSEVGGAFYNTEPCALQLVYGSAAFTGNFAGKLGGFTSVTMALTNTQTVVPVTNGTGPDGYGAMVFLNGILLEPTTDYTIDSVGTAVTLVDGVVGATSSLTVVTLKTINMTVSTTAPPNPTYGDIWINGGQ